MKALEGPTSPERIEVEVPRLARQPSFAIVRLRHGGQKRNELVPSASGREWIMGNIARPPCDEATILAGSCGRPATTDGPWILAATILGSSMAFIDGTVVNVALPALQSALHANISDVQWVVESYALFLAALLLIGGSLGDLYGRRKIFAAGVVLFSISSAWCGLAPNIGQLIVARGLQGMGGALLVPGSLALISANFAQKERGRAIGTWSGFTSITAAIGPVLGGCGNTK